MVLDFLLPLMLTIVIESIVLCFFKFKDLNVFKAVFLINVITNLTFNVFIVILDITGIYRHQGLSLLVVTLEMLIMISEYYLLKFVFADKYNLKRIVWLVVVMNLISYLVGYIVFWVL